MGGTRSPGDAVHRSHRRSVSSCGGSCTTGQAERAAGLLARGVLPRPPGRVGAAAARPPGPTVPAAPSVAESRCPLAHTNSAPLPPTTPHVGATQAVSACSLSPPRCGPPWSRWRMARSRRAAPSPDRMQLALTMLPPGQVPVCNCGHQGHPSWCSSRDYATPPSAPALPRRGGRPSPGGRRIPACRPDAGRGPLHTERIPHMWAGRRRRDTTWSVPWVALRSPVRE